MSPNDSANFLLFLQQLRGEPVGQSLRLTAAVSTTPFVGLDGTPMADVSEFSKVLDYIGQFFWHYVSKNIAERLEYFQKS
jgi:chitinase